MELLVVLGILGAVGSLVILTVSRGMTITDGSGDSLTANEVATRTTFDEIQKALLGDSVNSGYFTHNLVLPSRIAGLFDDVDSSGSFDFATGRGWNGPYLIETGARYGETTEPADADNFIAAYGDDDDPAVLDAWGKPIILQQPDTDDARLVSAGPDGLLETDPNDPVDTDRGDDLIQFLLAIDPNL
ncbi:MAG: hypothetical protein AAGH40_06580 [Verrucomicrobiota bacterium]